MDLWLLNNTIERSSNSFGSSHCQILENHFMKQYFQFPINRKAGVDQFEGIYWNYKWGKYNTPGQLNKMTCCKKKLTQYCW